MDTYLHLVHEAGASALRQLTYGDVHWSQIEPQDNSWNFSNSDSVVGNKYGLQIIPTFYHISAGGNANAGLQVPWRNCQDNSCGWDAATDSSDSKDYVQTVVNRYKSTVHYWEISNEMSGKMKRPNGLPLPDFIEFMQMNHRWIRQADPKAMVLMSGLLGTYGLPMANPRGWFRNFLARGGTGSFDILSYHDYNSWWTLPVHYDSLKAVLAEFGLSNLPVWCTESSISSDASTKITPDYASVDQQAADVWRRPSVLFARGLDVYFWHSSWSSGGNSEWREFGLLSSTGKKKKSFHAYQLLSQKLKGFTDAQPLSFGNVNDDNQQGGDGTWVVQYNWGDSLRRWVAWSPNRQSYLLQGLKSTQLTITTVVPLSISSNGESAEFDRQTVSVNNGTALLSLSDYPILIEEASATGFAVHANIPGNFMLEQNYPNPFNPSTQIRYHLPVSGETILTIYNLSGQKVQTLVHAFETAGMHLVQFNAASLASGIYFYRLRFGKRQITRKMIFIP